MSLRGANGKCAAATKQPPRVQIVNYEVASLPSLTRNSTRNDMVFYLLFLSFLIFRTPMVKTPTKVR
jgi:hypothetical protein